MNHKLSLAYETVVRHKIHTFFFFWIIIARGCSENSGLVVVG